MERMKKIICLLLALVVTLGGGVCVVMINGADMRENLGGYADRLVRVFEEVSAGSGVFRFLPDGE